MSIESHYMYVDFRDADFGMNGMGYNVEDMQFDYDNGFSYHVGGRAIADGTTVSVWDYAGKEGAVRIPVTVNDNLNGAFGGIVTIDGSSHLYPYQSLWTVGSHSVTAAAQLGPNWAFDHWSDGGARSHTVTVSETDFGLVLTANYVQNPRRPEQTSSLGITCSVYPNPFNPSTVIRFSILYRSHVRLAVYNSLGQIVADLVNEEIDAGNHEVHFDGRNLPSGVFFIRMAAGSFVERRKLLLVK